MKKAILLSQAFTLILSSQLFAGVLTLKPGTQTTNGVSIATGATATLPDGKSYDLTTVGSGLRKKYIAGIPIKVYVAQLMVLDASKFNRDTTGTAALDSLASENAEALQMTFVRDVNGGDIVNAYKDALSKNGVSLDRSDVVDFLKVVTAAGQAQNGKTLTIVGEKASDTIYYEDNNGNLATLKGNGTLVRDVFSNWLGASADRGLSELRNTLIGH